MRSLAVVLCLACAAEACAQETPLDARRRQYLQKLDQAPLGPPDASYPGPNRTLKNKYWEYEYQAKILSVFALVDRGLTPAARLQEANELLRYVTLGKYAATSATSFEKAQNSSAWKHQARSLAVRIWMLFSGWLDADLKQEFQKRFQWLLIGPFTNSSENIQFNNNEARFLAHEILGKQSLSTYADLRQWWISRLKSFGKDGAAEWGTTYNGWSLGSVLNLAEFAQDPTVRKLATMAVDYALARLSGFQVQGYFCSGAVRRYYQWTFACVPPQTHLARALFFGPAEFSGWTDAWSEWAASNYRPLVAVETLYQNGAGESRIRETKWTHYNYRGAKYSIATQWNFEPDYYGTDPGTHDVTSCFVQSAKGPANHVVPYGLPIGSDTKWRSTVESAFGYRNVAIVRNGGLCKRTWTGGVLHEIPSRLFYYKDFTAQIQGGWAFLTDGVIYVAWAPSVGDPIADPDSAQLADPAKMGAFLRSDAAPTDEGEVSVVEVGDAASFGSFDAFRSDVLARNPHPTWSNQQLVYHANDGATIVFGAGFASVNGQVANVASHPRASMPGVNGFSVSGVQFHFDTATTTGNTARMTSNALLGQTGPPPLQIATEATLPGANQGMVYSVGLAATGGASPYAWVKIWGSLPPGLSLAGSTIAGTPQAAGTWAFRIRVVDSTGAISSRVFSLTVGPPVPLAVTTPGTLPAGKKGSPYQQALEAAGGSGVYPTWVKIWGTLPPGLAVSGSKIVGTPSAAGTWTFRIRVIDSAGTVTSRLFTLKVAP